MGSKTEAKTKDKAKTRAKDRKDKKAHDKRKKEKGDSDNDTVQDGADQDATPATGANATAPVATNAAKVGEPIPPAVESKAAELWKSAWNEEYKRHYFFKPGTTDVTWVLPPGAVLSPDDP